MAVSAHAERFTDHGRFYQLLTVPLAPEWGSLITAVSQARHPLRPGRSVVQPWDGCGDGRPPRATAAESDRTSPRVPEQGPRAEIPASCWAMNE